MDLRAYLDQMGLSYDWSHHDTAYTAQDLAMKVHTSGKKVIKPVVVRADGQFVLCALPASYYVDLERVREELNAADAEIVEESQMQGLFPDCELGAEPPIGRIFGLPTLMDDSLQSQDEVMFQAGTHQDAIRMHLQDYILASQPKIGHFAKLRA